MSDLRKVNANELWNNKYPDFIHWLIESSNLNILAKEFCFALEICDFDFPKNTVISNNIIIYIINFKLYNNKLR